MSESQKTTRQHNFKTFNNMTRNHQKIRLNLIRINILHTE